MPEPKRLPLAPHQVVEVLEGLLADAAARALVDELVGLVAAAVAADWGHSIYGVRP